MRRVVTTALVSLLCPGMVLLTGCSDDKPAAQPPVSSADTPTKSTTSAPATTEPPDPGPTAPVMPERAKQHSTAGAKAFVRYYIDVLNYSWTLGSGDAIRASSVHQCRVCRGIAGFVDEVVAHGGHQPTSAVGP